MMMFLFLVLLPLLARVLWLLNAFSGLSDATITMAPGFSVAPVILKHDLGLLLLELQRICFIGIAPLDEGPALDALGFA